MTLRDNWNRVLTVAVAVAGTAALVAVGSEQGVGAAGGAGQAAASGAARSVLDGVYTAEQAKRGRGHYEKRCVLCHLDRGQGHEGMPEIVGQSLEREGDPEAPPVAGEAFQKKWGGRNAWELFSTMADTMPVGGPRSLAPQEYADVLAYILELNKFPAGQSAITPARDQLEPIAIGR
jgi:cytochrome c